MLWKEQIVSTAALCRVYECSLKAIIYLIALCWNPCVPCVCTCAWLCLFYIWAFIRSISAHMCFHSGAWTIYFFFLQTRKLSAKRKFLFLNLARPWDRLPLQFHPVCIIQRLMASDHLRDALQASNRKCHILFPNNRPFLQPTWGNGKQI